MKKKAVPFVIARSKEDPLDKNGDGPHFSRRKFLSCHFELGRDKSISYNKLSLRGAKRCGNLNLDITKEEK